MKLEHRGNCIIMKNLRNDEDEARGLFDYYTRKIYVSSSLGLLERECVYFHELSHRECVEQKCGCWDKDTLCEYHAMKGELQKVIARNSTRLTKAYLKNVQRCLNKYLQNRRLWRHHLAATRRLRRTQTYKKLSDVHYKIRTVRK